MMLNLDPAIAGFTTWTAEGHGFGFANVSTSERVRGRVKRAVLIAVLPRCDVEILVVKLAAEAPIPHLTYWIEPVEAFGHLATATVKRAIAQARTSSNNDPESQA